VSVAAVSVLALASLGADDCLSSGGAPPADPCAGYATCGACAGDASCGWCGDDASCHDAGQASACQVWSATPSACPTTCDQLACRSSGGHCTPSGDCVRDQPICGRVTCPDSYTWSWTTGGGGSNPTCCIDVAQPDGYGASCGQAPGGTCEPTGGESPSDETVTYAPATTMHCALPSGTIDCPALYIGEGGSPPVPVYVPGCCAETTSGAICGVGADGCYPPQGQTPVQ
jgi:hypothetical protein